MPSRGAVEATYREGHAMDEDQQPSEADVEQVERERAERLAEENRPEGAEVDNTGRDFDPEKGMFTDREDHASTGRTYPPLEEQDS